MLYLVGLGLRGIRSLSIEGESIIRRSDEVMLEGYTSIPPSTSLKDLETYFGKPIKYILRSDIETSLDLFREASVKDIAIIITGDPLSATTHNQIRLDMKTLGIPVEVIENSSILTEAISRTGLFHYRFGPPISLPFISEKFMPRSVLDKIKKNMENRFHSLILLDLESGRPMTPSEASNSLLQLEMKYGIGSVSPDDEVILISSLHMNNERIIRATLSQLLQLKDDFGPCCLILVSCPENQEKVFLDNFTIRFDEEFSEDKSPRHP